MAIVQNTIVKAAAALIEEDVVDQALMAFLYDRLNLHRYK